MESSSSGSGPKRCLNCHAVATHAYCPKCGQPSCGLRAGFLPLIREFLHNWFSSDARIWPTLKRLMLEPGHLTLAYQQGRRFRYVSPLRLYLATSLTMFLLFSMRPGEILHLSADLLESETPIGLDLRESFGIEQPSDGSWLEARVLGWADRWDALHPDQRKLLVNNQIRGGAPVALFLLLPVLALFLRILWIRSGLLYFDHFIFGLHLQAFLCVLLSLLLLPPWPAWLPPIGLLVLPLLYLVRAQTRAYGCGTWPALWRSLVFGMLMLPSAMVVTAGLVLYGLFSI